LIHFYKRQNSLLPLLTNFMMPPKKKGRTTRAKPQIVELTPEEQQVREQCDLLLKDFDKQCEKTIKEAWLEVETVSASINTMYKLEMLKLPQEIKNMKWDDYYKQSLEQGHNPLALSEAISSCIEDSICATVDTQVSQLKSAIKNTAQKKARGRKKAYSDSQPPPSTGTRSSSRSRTTRILSDTTNTETPSTRSLRGKNSTMATPANTRMPNMGKTPMITPKFDTTSLSRTVSRVARHGEVLVSLSGSPVSFAPKTKGVKAQDNQNVLIPMGTGETLNVPLGGDENAAAHLDDEQVQRLEELQRSLANMLKMRKEADDLSG